MSDRYLAHIVIEFRRELAIASKLDVRQVEMDIAARRREANVGKRWALQRDRIQRELAKLGTNENDWIKQALGSFAYNDAIVQPVGARVGELCDRSPGGGRHRAIGTAIWTVVGHWQQRNELPLGGS